MLGEGVGVIPFTSTTSSYYLITEQNKTLQIVNTKHTKVFHIHLISGATASNITIQNGNGGTTVINITGTINKGIDFDFGVWGIDFPLGAYVTYDGNQTGGTIACKALTDETEINTVFGDNGNYYYIDAVGGNDSNNGKTAYTPWKTMTKASGISFPSGSVINCSGLYTDALIPTNSGILGSPITFQQWPNQAQWQISSGAILNCISLQIRSYINISGVICSNATHAGLFITSGTNCIFNNIIAHDTGTATGFFAGIRINGSNKSTGLVFNNCICYNNQSAGFEGGGTMDGVVFNNCIAYNNGLGTAEEGFEFFPNQTTFTSGWTNLTGNIYFQSVSLAGDQKLTRVVQSTNKIELSLNSGNFASLANGQWDFHAGSLYINVGVDPSTVHINFPIDVLKNVTLNNCIAHDNPQLAAAEGNGIEFDNFCFNCTANYCIAYNNGGVGFVSNESQNCSFNYCLSYNNSGGGFFSNDLSSGINFYNCTSVSNIGDGIGIFNPSNLSAGFIIQNCISSSNSAYGINGSAGLTGVAESYNDSYGNTTANWTGSISQAPTDISLNPLYTDSIRNNYILASDSPCLGKGVNIGFIKDIRGVTVPGSTGIDMGCYQTP